MEKIFVKVAKNDEFEVVGYAVFMNDVCLFRRGCTTNPDFYYVKNITVNVETYTKIITLNAGIEMMEKAEHDFSAHSSTKQLSCLIRRPTRKAPTLTHSIWVFIVTHAKRWKANWKKS